MKSQERFENIYGGMDHMVQDEAKSRKCNISLAIRVKVAEGTAGKWSSHAFRPITFMDMLAQDKRQWLSLARRWIRSFVT